MWHVHETQPDRRLGRRAFLAFGPAYGVQQGQGKGDSDAFEAVATIEHGCIDHDFLPYLTRRWVNG